MDSDNEMDKSMSQLDFEKFEVTDEVKNDELSEEEEVEVIEIESVEELGKRDEVMCDLGKEKRDR